MNDKTYYAAAPGVECLREFEFRRDSDGQFAPTCCRWCDNSQTAIFDNVLPAVEDACDLCEEDMESAYTVVAIIQSPRNLGWKIDHGLPVVAWRGNLWQAVPAESIETFIGGLKNE